MNQQYAKLLFLPFNQQRSSDLLFFGFPFNIEFIIFLNEFLFCFF